MATLHGYVVKFVHHCTKPLRVVTERKSQQAVQGTVRIRKSVKSKTLLASQCVCTTNPIRFVFILRRNEGHSVEQ